jgi:hypothetical protein
LNGGKNACRSDPFFAVIYWKSVENSRIFEMTAGITKEGKHKTWKMNGKPMGEKLGKQ